MSGSGTNSEAAPAVRPPGESPPVRRGPARLPRFSGLDYRLERGFWKTGLLRLAGVDEAGRGPLAGPVVAAAVIFPPEVWIHGVDDSKKLTHERREELFPVIGQAALTVGIGVVSHEVIDEINIYWASMRAMAEAVSALKLCPDHLLIDGPRYTDTTIPSTPLVGGDGRCFSIAAASIIAKVTRDRLMAEFDRRFPVYGFARHKGYATPEHLGALRKHGPCEIHRRSFHMPEMAARDHE